MVDRFVLKPGVVLMGDSVLVLQVGHAHPSMGQRLPLEDGMVAGLLGGIPVLVIGLRRPIMREVLAVERGAWVVEVEGAGCWEATYTPLVEDAHMRALADPLPEAGEHLAVQVHLVDGDSGQIEAMRVVGAPPRFSAALRALHQHSLDSEPQFTPAAWKHACALYAERHRVPRDGFRSAAAEFAVGPAL
jgi:hypothetical protein